MSVTGRPTDGFRLSVTLGEASPSALIYRGFVHLPAADVPAEVTVDLPAAGVRVALGEGGTAELTKAAAALVRAAVKAPIAAGSAPPRKIVRWRA